MNCMFTSYGRYIQPNTDNVYLIQHKYAREDQLKKLDDLKALKYAGKIKTAKIEESLNFK